MWNKTPFSQKGFFFLQIIYLVAFNLTNIQHKHKIIQFRTEAFRDRNGTKKGRGEERERQKTHVSQLRGQGWVGGRGRRGGLTKLACLMQLI